MIRYWRWLIVIGVVAFLFGNRTFRQVIRQQRALRRVQAQIRQMKQEEKDYRSRIERLDRDPQYLEDMARLRAGMVKKGEIRYRFPDKDSGKSESK